MTAAQIDRLEAQRKRLLEVYAQQQAAKVKASIAAWAKLTAKLDQA